MITLLILISLTIGVLHQPVLAIDYPIVYVRAPRKGDTTHTRWQEVSFPYLGEPGTDLVVLHPDSTEKVLVPGGNGAAVDPVVSFDGKFVYYAYWHDLRQSGLFNARFNIPIHGADLFKVEVATGQITQLTHQEWEPPTGVAKWSSTPLRPAPPGTVAIGFGVISLAPCPLPGGKVLFTSNRNNHQFGKQGLVWPSLQLFVLDEKLGTVEKIGFLNLGSALHPVILMDGRVVFASSEAQGLRDTRLWGIWGIYPDGRSWEPLLSAFTTENAVHFHAQKSDGKLVTTIYYNGKNHGLGALVDFNNYPPGRPLADQIKRFGMFKRADSSNPLMKFLLSSSTWFETRMPFSPHGLRWLTPFATPEDTHGGKLDGQYTGKIGHPAGAPNNDLLVVWSGGPVHQGLQPVVDGGIYILPKGDVAVHPNQLTLIKNDPNYNEQQPRALVPYKAIYGIDQPTKLPWLPNEGKLHAALPPGTPYGLVGSSSLYNRTSEPDPWMDKTYHDIGSSNWLFQGSDAGEYPQSDIASVRFVMQEPNSLRNLEYKAAFFSHGAEVLRIMGDIPVRKILPDGTPANDPTGAPDTSFLAKIPSDVAFTFQMLDHRGLVLTNSQTWHQIRPGEVRTNCGGCHAHDKEEVKFEVTAAGKSGFPVADLTLTPPVDIEFMRDIAIVLDAKCISCHNEGTKAGGLRLDQITLDDRQPIRYRTLANDPTAKYTPSIDGKWYRTQVSRYIRKFQSRRSLLIWKVYGERLDGLTNDTYPTETVKGDPKTLPAGVSPRAADIDYIDGGCVASTVLTPKEQQTFARWVDLGSPIQLAPDGWFTDETPPTLVLTVAKGTTVPGPPPCPVGCVITLPEQPVCPTGCLLDTTQPPPVLCPAGCMIPGSVPPTSSGGILRVGMTDISGLDMSTFKITQDGLNITPKAQPEENNPGVWKVGLGVDIGQGVFKATICDKVGPSGRGNCTTKTLAAQW